MTLCALHWSIWCISNIFFVEIIQGESLPLLMAFHYSSISYSFSQLLYKEFGDS